MMKLDHPVAAVAIVALYVGIAMVAGGLAGHFAGQKVAKRVAVSKTVITMPTVSSKSRRHSAWNDLDQSEVDALTMRLKAIIDGRKPVQIVCADRSLCGDLALDLENAFESARWPVSIVAPFTDDGRVDGVRVSSRSVAGALSSGTSLPISVTDPADPSDETISVYLGRP